jgi:hypothetical protein
VTINLNPCLNLLHLHLYKAPSVGPQISKHELMLKAKDFIYLFIY